MRLVQEFGCPNFFISVTCNPRWNDISCNLHHDNEDPTHRYDLISRVFRLKLNAIVNDISKKQLFGKCIVVNYSIEFQKRGLPHAHMLVYLDKSSKLRTPDDVDKFISAEFPRLTGKRLKRK